MPRQSHEAAAAKTRPADPATTAHMRRAIMRLALLMRAVPLLQAVATLGFGFPVYQRPWLGVLTGSLALAWSAWLAVRVWPDGRCTVRMSLADAAVALLALVAIGVAMPPWLLTTSFYWAAAYAAAVALLLGLSLPAPAGAAVLAVLITGYALLVFVRADAGAIPAAAGNAAGAAVYFAFGVLIAGYVRKLGTVIERAREGALHREEQLGAEQARLDEFRRLHDEAVQVLERVSAAGERETPGLRAYAASAAAHLRGAAGHPGPGGGSVRDVLDRAAAEFAVLGFSVTVEAGLPLPLLPGEAMATLAAAVTESLNNAYKHSGADRALVRATALTRGIEVSVEDKGAGFAPGPARHGFGITNCIRRRLEEAGGGAEIRSAPGAGTVVRMWLPC